VQKLSEFGQNQANLAAEQNDFRQAGLAILNYESAHQTFPFDNEDDELGWRVHVLPYLDQNKTYVEFDLDEGHASETNTKMIDKMPKIMGKGGKDSTIAWIQSSVTGFADITDGSSNTIMLIEYPAGQPWLENGGLSVEKAVELVTGLEDGEELIVTFYDCSTRTISNKFDKSTLENLFRPDDGNVIDMDF